MSTTHGTAPGLRGAVAAGLGFVLLCLAALAMLLVCIATAWRAREWCMQTLVGGTMRAILRLAGLRVELVGRLDRGGPQVVYIANHSSTIDTFVIAGLGLRRTRFFLSQKTRRILPLGVIGACAGTFFTPPQSEPEARRALFQRAERTLRETGDSAFLTPEGTRVLGPEIGKFNRGAFHLALSLGVPIVPLYLDIPPEADPGKGIVAGQGTVRVTVLPTVATSGWRTETLERHIDHVRSMYVARARERNRTRAEETHT